MGVCMPTIGWLATGGDASAYRYLLRELRIFQPPRFSPPSLTRWDFWLASHEKRMPDQKPNRYAAGGQMISVSISIDVPDLVEAVQFYTSAFGFSKSAEPIPGVVVLRAGNTEICLLEKSPGSKA